MESLAERHAQGTFPLSPETVGQRLANVRIVFADGLALEDFTASHNHTEGIIRLDVDLTEGMEHILFHELLHAVSGVVATTELPRTEDGARKTDHQYSNAQPYSRQGLSISPDPVVNRARRFSWLNEACTEVLAMDLTNTQSSDVYPDERRLLAALEARVPRELFITAQYEDFEPGIGTPAWGELSGQLAKAFEPNILTTLDRILNEVRAEGASERIMDESRVDAALSYLASLDHSAA